MSQSALLLFISVLAQIIQAQDPQESEALAIGHGNHSRHRRGEMCGLCTLTLQRNLPFGVTAKGKDEICSPLYDLSNEKDKLAEVCALYTESQGCLGKCEARKEGGLIEIAPVTFLCGRLADFKKESPCLQKTCKSMVQTCMTSECEDHKLLGNPLWSFAIRASVLIPYEELEKRGKLFLEYCELMQCLIGCVDLTKDCGADANKFHKELALNWIKVRKEIVAPVLRRHWPKECDAVLSGKPNVAEPSNSQDEIKTKYSLVQYM